MLTFLLAKAHPPAWLAGGGKRPSPLDIRASARFEQRVRRPLAIRDRRRFERRVTASTIKCAIGHFVPRQPGKTSLPGERVGRFSVSFHRIAILSGGFS
jgi:hypothetical protein